MAEIINLRRARKAKARDAAAALAAANRALHGRSKSEKALAQAERARREALLDGAAIPPDSPEPGTPPAG
jgi:hypothetical protein